MLPLPGEGISNLQHPLIKIDICGVRGTDGVEAGCAAGRPAGFFADKMTVTICRFILRHQEATPIPHRKANAGTDRCNTPSSCSACTYQATSAAHREHCRSSWSLTSSPTRHCFSTTDCTYITHKAIKCDNVILRTLHRLPMGGSRLCCDGPVLHKGHGQAMHYSLSTTLFCCQMAP